MTKHEAAIVAAYTGMMLGEFDDMHAYIEKIMGRPVFTHELGDKAIVAQVHELSKPDFTALEVK